MNFVTFVFSLLLIFAFGTFVVLEKRSDDQKIRKTYTGHIRANRKLLSDWESKTYESFRSPSEKKGDKTTPSKLTQTTVPEINPSSSRLNLWKLVQDGKEKQPLLYNTALNLLDAHYGKTLFKNRPQEKGLFLNAFLKKTQEAIQKHHFSLEKLMMDPALQLNFYKMLKGTKNWIPEEEVGYPSLLDILKVEEDESQLCLYLAHRGQLMALFGKKAGLLLYNEMHKEDGAIPTKELIEEIFSKAHLMAPKDEFLDLFEMGRHRHLEKGKTTLIASDDASGIRIRKNVYTPFRK